MIVPTLWPAGMRSQNKMRIPCYRKLCQILLLIGETEELVRTSRLLATLVLGELLSRSPRHECCMVLSCPPLPSQITFASPLAAELQPSILVGYT